MPVNHVIQQRGIRCVCKQRNVVERTINRPKDFQAVATRYDKRGWHYLATVTVATIMLWLL